MNQVFITGASAYLPNDPVENDAMEGVLGQVGAEPSRHRSKILARNGIKQRYYARKHGMQTHLNEELAACAVTDLLNRQKVNIENIQMLAAGTTAGDLMVPGFGSMLHGRLGGQSLEVVTGAGVCCASMIAFKAAFNALRCGDHCNAVVVGSELASAGMKASRFKQESQVEDSAHSHNDSFKYFNADFLRWMLSDGAGAWLLDTQPKSDQLSLRVDWVKINSYANLYPTCMYMGTSKTQDLSPPDSYLSYETYGEAEARGLMVIRQDTRLLPIGLEGSVVAHAISLRDKGLINADKIDHFLPHISSMIALEPFYQSMARQGLDIDKDRWFTNLSTKGNTGAASIFISLEEAFNGGLFKEGERILLMVPESGRFMSCYVHLTCVGN
jgi:3-oxoacyl-[acyl-carrier-protein] synthase-3